MKQLGKQVAAYIGFSLSVIVASMVLGLLIGAVESGYYWLFVGWVWLLIVGAPAILWASYNLSKELGIKPAPSLRVIEPRTATIGGGLFDFSIPTRRQLPAPPTPRLPAPTVDLSDYHIQLGDYAINRRTLLSFLSEVEGRQQRGKPPFSRTHFVNRTRLFDEPEYNAVMAILIHIPLISGRKQGRSGKLMYSPPRCMAIIDRSV